MASVPWLESARSCIRQAQQSSICEQGQEIDSETCGQPMCLKGFPSLEVSHRLLRVGFVGSNSGEPDLQCFAPVGRSKQTAEGR
jgi:hypothetical protein